MVEYILLPLEIATSCPNGCEQYLFMNCRLKNQAAFVEESMSELILTKLVCTIMLIRAALC